jgi:hypothetical protein
MPLKETFSFERVSAICWKIGEGTVELFTQNTSPYVLFAPAAATASWRI